MTYEQALSYIHENSWTRAEPGLHRIKELLEHIGEPQSKLRFIHVAGTNGKGSFCSMLSGILEACGLKVGRFTSPYIRRFNDRICINGKEIPDTALSELVEFIQPHAERMEQKPTEFELITAIGMEYFRREQCDIVILEAGLGGRLDSTNIIKAPLLSVITGIDYDHTAILGDTLEKIAYEKAGIIKEGCPVLVAQTAESISDIFKKEAAQKKSKIYFCNNADIAKKSMTLDGSIIDFGKHKDIKIPLLGEYQIYNAALVLCAADILKESLCINEQSIKNGILHSIWHARFELLSTEPCVIYDGAHNPQGIQMLKKSILEYFGTKKIILVSSVMRDKDYKSMITELCDVCECVFVFKANERALEQSTLAQLWREHRVSAAACESMSDAVSAAIDKSRQKHLPVICAGSLYMYAQIRDELSKVI